MDSKIYEVQVEYFKSRMKMYVRYLLAVPAL